MRFIHIPCLGAAMLSAWLSFVPGALAEPVRVVASIKPLHSLVSMVLDGIGEPYLIVKGAGSPHGHAMRPSDARALAQAEAVFWVGPEMETFLVKPMQTLPSSARVVDMLHEGDEDPAHEAKKAEGNDTDHGHGDGGGHEHQGIDPHIWLNPVHAVEMIERIAEVMTDVIPAHAERIASNRDAAIEQLIDVDAEVRRLVSPMQNNHVVVLHEAYGHFTEHYDLLPFIALSVTPEHKPTPGKIHEVRKKIFDLGVRCVFAEPQFPDTFVRLLTEGTKAHATVIDPLGAQLIPGPDLYPQLLRLMGFAIRGCYEEAS